MRENFRHIFGATAVRSLRKTDVEIILNAIIVDICHFLRHKMQQVIETIHERAAKKLNYSVLPHG